MSAKHTSEDAHTSGAAIAGLVIGVIALVSSWVPIINNFSFFLALVGLVIAIVGVVGTRRGKRTGKGLAIAALVVNLVAAGMVLATQSLYSAALDEITSSSSSSSSDDDDEETEVQEADVDEDSDTQEAEYLVTIDGATVTTDYSGDPAIVVELTFTNNSDEATSYYLECSDKAFQNGVELGTAIVSGLETNYTTELKPGASVTVYRAYSLSDESDVTVEVEEWLSWDDTILAEATFSVA